MSGAMIDRCNANSAHHRAFITNPPSLSSLLWNRYILLTRNPVTSHAHFSLDNLVIYHPWRSRDRFSSTNKGISFPPLPHPDYSFLFLKNPFSLQFKTKNQIDSAPFRNDIFSVATRRRKNRYSSFLFFSFFSTYPNVSITEQKREKGRRRREKEKEKLVKKVDTSNVTIQLVPL